MILFLQYYQKHYNKIGLQISIEKMDNLKEMDEFSDHVLAIKWNKNKLSNLNKPIKTSGKEKQI